jgi:hypothetical protein
MLKTRSKRLANSSAEAAQRLAGIEKAIVELSNDDLLDLADIFRSTPAMPLAKMALAEMTKRGISL